jgi:hypothetical protein
VYFVRRALLNGATLQAYVHDDTPHVFPMYGFTEIGTFKEGLNEIRGFIAAIGGKIETKAERILWDGSRDPISDEEYIRISRDDVFPSLPWLIQLIKRMEKSIKSLDNNFSEFKRRNPQLKYVATPVS